MFIHETDHASSNFTIQRTGDLLSLRLSYPPYTDADNPAGKRRKVRKIEIDQLSTRSSDGIRVSYDYDRDGWVIEQPRMRDVQIDDRTSDMVMDWAETAFLQSHARQETGDIPWLDHPEEALSDSA